MKSLLLSIILVCLTSIVGFSQVTNMKVVNKLGNQAPDSSLITALNQPSINSKGEVAYLGTDGKEIRLFITKNVFSNPTTEILAKRGTPIPGLSGLDLLKITFPKINERGDVLFSGTLSQNLFGGLFIASDGQINKVIVDGTKTPIGGVFVDLALSSLFTFNNNGEVTLVSAVADGSSDVGVFTIKNDQINKVVANGDMLADGTKLKITLETVPAINDQGDVLFSAATETEPNKLAIYLFSQGQVKKVVGSGDTTVDGEKLDMVLSSGRYLNDKREILFSGKVGTSDGIYLYSAETKKITKLIANGDPAPDGGIFRGLSISLTPAHGALINNSRFVFRAGTTKTIYGLFYFKDGKIIKIVGHREPTPLGGVFADNATFNCAMLGAILTEKDQVVFETTITGGSSPKALIAWSENALTAPTINSANYDKKSKLLTIKALGIKTDLQVEINNKLITQPIKLISDSELSLKGNRKKLNLNKDANTNRLVLISSDGLRSEAFVF